MPGTVIPVDERRRRLAPGARKEVIEDAAERLFAHDGFAATRVEDIARESGISPQMLLRYFASKEELHLALLAKHRDRFLSQIPDDKDSRGSDAEDRVRARAEAWLRYVELHPDGARLLFRETTGLAGAADVHRTMQAAARQRIVDALRASDQVELDASVIEPLAETIRAGSVGLVLWWIDHPTVPKATVLLLLQALWTELPRTLHVTQANAPRST
jgi:AcrR family transcriptional regulator